MKHTPAYIALLPLAALAALVLVFLTQLNHHGGGFGRDPMAGRRMPDIPGMHRPLGEAYILNIFASWCAPCAMEHPVLKSYAAMPGALPVYGIAYKDKEDDVARYLARHGNIYEAHIRDDTGRIGIELGIGGVPESLLVDESGMIVKRFEGPFTSLEMLQEWVAE